MPDPRKRWVSAMLYASVAMAVTVVVLSVHSKKVDVRVSVTGILRTNGVLRVSAAVTNCGPITVIWGGGDTPFNDVRWLSQAGWVTSTIPNGSHSSLGEIRPGESFEHSFEVPASAQKVQALARFEVFSLGDRIRDPLIRSGIVSPGGVISEFLRERPQRRDDLDLASDVMTVNE